MVLKVAIIGLSTRTHHLAPWDDPTWEKWGLPWDDFGWTRMSRLFEMHDQRLLDSKHSKRCVHYAERLKDCPILYMQEARENAIQYPFDEVGETVGQAYWNSSIAYALALAIHEGAQEISIFGVDMDGTDEYFYQRPNLEYLVGVARGKGIKVHIPDESPLCKFQGEGVFFYEHEPVYVDRYGWLG